MASLPRGTVIHFECPACSWPKAVLAFEQQGIRTAFCPYCQHLWHPRVRAQRPGAVARRESARQFQGRQERANVRCLPADRRFPG